MRPLAFLLLSAFILAGCLGDSKGPTPAADESSVGSSAGNPDAPQTTGVEPTSSPGPLDQATAPESASPALETRLVLPPAVVVADISPGANPYHVRHQRPNWTHHPSLRVPGIPAELPALDLTFTGDQAADLAADAAVWATYNPGQVYWVPETNLLLLTLDSYVPQIGGADGYNVEFFHGIATADAIGQSCPDCYVLAVQDWANIDGSAVQMIADDLPWVDFVTSTSFGMGTEEYADAVVSEGYASATRALWERGGLGFAPSGNGLVTPNAQWFVVCGVGCVSTFSMHFVNLPPWVVLVGGSESECRGVAFSASKPTEVVSDFTQTLALHGGSNVTGVISGTSFSTPKTAGVFAETLRLVRQTLGGSGSKGALWSGPSGPGPFLDDGKLTNEELREAIHQAATQFQTSDFAIPCLLNPAGTLGPGPVPASATPWFDMGWGHLGANEAAIAAEVILTGKTLERDPATVAWMESFQDARASVYPW